MALLPTPASVFNNQTRYGYLDKAYSTLSYQKYAVARAKILLITLINMINLLIKVIMKRATAYFSIAERGICFV